MNVLPEAVCELIVRRFVADHPQQFRAWLQAHGVPAEQAGERVLELAMRTAAAIAAALPDEPADQPETSAASTTPRTSPRILL